MLRKGRTVNSAQIKKENKKIVVDLTFFCSVSQSKSSLMLFDVNIYTVFSLITIHGGHQIRIFFTRISYLFLSRWITYVHCLLMYKFKGTNVCDVDVARNNILKMFFSLV